MHLPQPHVQRLLLPLAAHEPRPKPKRCNRRLACVAAAATVLHCVCSFVILAAAQKAAAEPFGTWSTANLSQARCELAAASLPNHGLAIFAGGNNASCSRFCDNFFTSSGCREGWVVMRMWGGGMQDCVVLSMLSCHMLCAGVRYCPSNVVDIFDATAGTWSTASLSEARFFLAAASLPDQGVAIFAGGASACGGVYCSGCREAWIVRGPRCRGYACVGIVCYVEHALLFHASRSCRQRRRNVMDTFQSCRYLQCDRGNLEHCQSQRGPSFSCSRIAAESRTRDLRWW
jgi:hypothetical protein